MRKDVFCHISYLQTYVIRSSFSSIEIMIDIFLCFVHIKLRTGYTTVYRCVLKNSMKPLVTYEQVICLDLLRSD